MEVEQHYLIHNEPVIAFPGPERATPFQEAMPPVEMPLLSIQDAGVEGTGSLAVEYSEDDDEFMDVDLPSLTVPSFSVGTGRGPLGSEPNGEEEWEEGSTYSDTSAEDLLCEDDDDVVPRSFNLPRSSSPSSNDGCLESDNQIPGSSLELTEEDPPPSASVYCSNSWYLPTAFTTLS